MDFGDEPPFVAGRPLTRDALAWAAERHRGQRRSVDRAPFILHPMEVAALLTGRGYDDEVTAAGLLHDVVEESDATTRDIERLFGPRVAHIVAALTEDPTVEEYELRKERLRAQVAAGGADARAVYAADKVVKVRELRAESARTPSTLQDPALLRRLEHYEASLLMLRASHPPVALVRQLEFELWALRRLPPAPGA